MKDRFVSFGGSHVHGTSLAFQVGVVVTDGTHPPFRTAPLFRSCQVQVPVRLASSKSWESATTTCVHGIATLDDVAQTGHMSKEYIMRIKLSHITSVLAAGAAAVAIAASPTAAAAEPATASPAVSTTASTSAAAHVTPAGFHGGGFHGGGFHGGGFHGGGYGHGFDRGGWNPWGWGPWFWGRH
jgi:hypothetical protein